MSSRKRPLYALRPSPWQKARGILCSVLEYSMISWNPDSSSDSLRAEKTYRGLTKEGFRAYGLDITEQGILRPLTAFDANLGRIVALRVTVPSKGSLDSTSG
jgi:hypothetical protein